MKEQVKTKRSYWSGIEAEQIIQRVAEGDTDLTEEAERLDVQIDPETAMVWLRRNKLNRKVSQTAVARYARDMAAGNFPYTHQGIAFDKNGQLLDGQHRLHAIIQSGCTIPMQVTVNMPPEVRIAIDQGKSRTVADVATLKTSTPIESKMSAVAMRMLASTNANSWSGTRTDAVDFIMKHLPAILYSIDHLPQKARISYAAVRAVIARAWYSVDTMLLERFCRILVSGGYAPEEEAVFKLREFIINKSCRSKDDARDIYAKTEWILNKFINGECPKVLAKVDRELFLLPEEQTALDALDAKLLAGKKSPIRKVK
jgi:hypothetical protein